MSPSQRRTEKPPSRVCGGTERPANFSSAEVDRCISRIAGGGAQHLDRPDWRQRAGRQHRPPGERTEATRGRRSGLDIQSFPRSPSAAPEATCAERRCCVVGRDLVRPQRAFYADAGQRPRRSAQGAGTVLHQAPNGLGSRAPEDPDRPIVAKKCQRRRRWQLHDELRSCAAR